MVGSFLFFQPGDQIKKKEETIYPLTFALLIKKKIINEPNYYVLHSILNY